MNAEFALRLVSEVGANSLAMLGVEVSLHRPVSAAQGRCAIGLSPVGSSPCIASSRVRTRPAQVSLGLS
jgi:hypothetical protein